MQGTGDDVPGHQSPLADNDRHCGNQAKGMQIQQFSYSAAWNQKFMRGQHARELCLDRRASRCAVKVRF
jgi:hypothetical protein